jgi:hypothetical protein
MNKISWALVMAAITAVLNWLVGFQWTGLNAGQAAAIIAAISAVAGIVVALRTRPVSPSVFAFGIAAIVSLMSNYGMHFSQQGVAMFTTAFLALAALITHGVISPKKDAPYTGVLGQTESRATSRDVR